MRTRENGDVSVEEVLSLLARTSLPTVVVEGMDDMIVYRRLEERLAHLGVSVLPVGGRHKVLSIFIRRNEIPPGVKLVFIADKDTWVNTGVPAEYQCSELIFTSGYSIENDVFIDGNLCALLSAGEGRQFAAELQEFLEWYALALSRHLNDASQPIALHPEHVLDPAQRVNLLQLAAGELYPQELRDQLHADYQRLVRGKSLIALLVRNTNYRGRQPRHSDKAILEMVAIRPGALLQQVSNAVEAGLTA